MKNSDSTGLTIAITGMACRFPGADNIEEYWSLIRDGLTSISLLPPHRFDQNLYYDARKGVPGKSYTKLGGVVAERPFDRSVCTVAEECIDSSEPSHAIMLEVAARACWHAGIDPSTLAGRNVGVYVGHARGSPLASEIAYSTHVEELTHFLETKVGAFQGVDAALRGRIARDLIEEVHTHYPRRVQGGRPVTSPGYASRLISQALRLAGPYATVDAACASSLYALALASHALRNGKIEAAIVGGASYSSWQSLVLFSHAQALSASGSFPFDQRADGFVSADGYAAIILKPLHRALEDGDRIFGVIRGIGISCDGRGKSLWAPLKEGQILAVRRAYRGNLDAGRIQYIEAHGTSTQLGDKTELEALASAIGKDLPAGKKIPVCSVKANIGHTRETAGLAGLLKVLLAMQHHVIPKAAGFEFPNPQIDWNSLPFFVPTSESAWEPHPDDGARQAAVDAFGIGGLNVHAFIEQLPTYGSQTQGAQTQQAASALRGKADDAVAIIGVGCVFPGAHTAEAFWDLLMSGRDPKVDVPADRWNPATFFDPQTKGAWRSPTKLGGFITDYIYDWKTHKIPPKQLESADLLQFLVLDAVDQALADSGYAGKAFDRSGVGVIVGTVFGGDFSSQLNLVLQIPAFERALRSKLMAYGVSEDDSFEVAAAFRESFYRNKPMLFDETGSYSSSTLASRIAKTLNLMGGAFAVDAGDASSFTGLQSAVDLLTSHSCDTVLCVGAQRTMDITMYELFATQGMLSPEKPRPAFSADGNGLVPGEGAGVVFLKRLADARRDGDKIYGVVKAIGSAICTDDAGTAVAEAMRSALRQADVRASEVFAVETAGLGIRNIDAGEADALVTVYGGNSRKSPLLIGSGMTQQIGHTQGASGIASLIKVVLGFHHGKIPPGRPAERLVDAFAQDPKGMQLVTQGAPMPPMLSGSRYVGVTAIAFRGLAQHVLLDFPVTDRVEVAHDRESWNILRFGAPTMPELVEQLTSAPVSGPELANCGVARFSGRDRARIAIVARDAASLKRKLSLSAEVLGRAGSHAFLEESGIFFRGEPATGHRVAFVFAGQGSQYLGMLRDLIDHFPPACAKLNEIDELMNGLGLPCFAEIAWREDSPLGTDVWTTQIALLLADTILYAVLESMGLRADVISAHSYGEYPALVAAGAWTLEQAVMATRVRCDLIANSRGKGAMIATNAPEETFEKLAATLGRPLYVANHNAPDQTVLGVADGDAEAVEKALAEYGFEARRLNVPRPFHTPLLADVQEPFAHFLSSQNIRPTLRPLLSSVTNRYVADPRDIRENLVAQLTRPVRYVELVKQLAADGAKIVVEIGPNQVLTRFHRRILADRDVMLVASDVPKRSGMEQLLYVRAALEAFDMCASAAAVTQQDVVGVNLVAASPQSPAAIVPARHQIIHFDATHRRVERMREKGQAHADTRAELSSPTKAKRASQLEAFIVNFVCEQTGYPPEVVDLDSDLEADLGIDSIKKAQLFGELREHFQLKIEADKGLSLSDFVSLRQVVDFLDRHSVQLEQVDATVPVTPAPIPKADAVTNLREIANAAASQIKEEADGLNVIRCKGTPHQIGRLFAQSDEARIREILQRYKKQLNSPVDDVQVLRDAFPHSDRYFTPSALEELQGMSEALKLPVRYLIAYNLGLYPPDGGCVQFAMTARSNGASGMILGVNEDNPLSLSLNRCLSRVMHVRHPDGLIPNVLFGTSGQVGGLTGINACGIAVTSTMLLDRAGSGAAGVGIIHPVIVKTILERAESIECAVEIVKNFERVGAWSLCLSCHLQDRICYVEYDGPAMAVRENCEILTTSNHSLLLSPVTPVPEHSVHRLNRLQSLLGSEECVNREFSVKDAQATLRDRYDLARERETAHPTMNTIRRVDNVISVIMQPAHGILWCTLGPSHGDRTDHFCKLDLRELLELEVPSQHAGGTRKRPEPEPPQDGSGSHGLTRDASLGTVMRRFVLRMADATRHGTRSFEFGQDALILGQSLVARALGDRLKEMGGDVHMLSPDLKPQEAIEELARLWQERRVMKVFIMTAWDELDHHGPAESKQAKRNTSGVLLPYLLCQEWLKRVREAKCVERSTLVAGTILGGDFGFAGRVKAVEGGWITGLLKGISREFEGLRVKVIDTPPDEPANAAVEAIVGELAGTEPEIEIGYVRGKRSIVKAVPRIAHTLTPAKIPEGGTWVLTGGARGVTALIAGELGARYSLKIHLLGRAPLTPVEESWLGLSQSAKIELKKKITETARQAGSPPLQAWQSAESAIAIHETLHSLATRGVQATYHCCDVSDRERLAEVLVQIRGASGPIEGIVHGAGVEAAARFERKELKTVLSTLAAKPEGCLNLMDLTRKDPLRYFIAFGSVSGRFGGLGQTDYSGASDLLAKRVQWFRGVRPDCRSICFHWPAWSGTGMAMRPESRLALETSGQKFMSPAEGFRHLMAELLVDAPEGEVLILDQPGSLDVDGIMGRPAEREAYERRTETILGSALVQGIHDLREGQSLSAELTFDPSKDPFLREHLFRGEPILPAVVGLECLAEAAQVLAIESAVVRMSRVEILSPLRFASERPQHATVRVALSGQETSCELVAPFYNRHDRLVDPCRIYMRGCVELASNPPTSPVQPPPELPMEIHSMNYPDETQAIQEHLVFHGPKLRCLRKVWLHREGACGHVLVPDPQELGRNRDGIWIVPAAVLDSCLVLCGVFSKVVLGLRQLPFGFREIIFYRTVPVGETCTASVSFRGRQDKQTLFDFTLFAEDGTVVLDVKGHSGVVHSEQRVASA